VSQQQRAATVPEGHVELTITSATGLKVEGLEAHQSAVRYAFRPGSRAKPLDARQGKTVMAGGASPRWDLKEVIPLNEKNLKDELLKIQERGQRSGRTAWRDKDGKCSIIFYLEHQAKGFAFFKKEIQQVAQTHLALMDLMDKHELKQSLMWEGVEGSLDVTVKIAKPLGKASLVESVQYEYLAFQGFDDDIAALQLELKVTKKKALEAGQGIKEASGANRDVLQGQYDRYRLHVTEATSRLKQLQNPSAPPTTAASMAAPPKGASASQPGQAVEGQGADQPGQASPTRAAQPANNAAGFEPPYPLAKVPCMSVLQSEIERLEGLMTHLVETQSQDRKLWNAIKKHLQDAKLRVEDLTDKFNQGTLSEDQYAAAVKGLYKFMEGPGRSSPLAETWLQVMKEEIASMGGDESPPVLRPWPIDDPTRIPSLAVLRWAATELQPHAQQNAAAAQKLHATNARIIDLEAKMANGTLLMEKYQGALAAMQKCLAVQSGPLVEGWQELLLQEVTSVSRDTRQRQLQEQQQLQQQQMQQLQQQQMQQLQQQEEQRRLLLQQQQAVPAMASPAPSVAAAPLELEQEGRVTEVPPANKVQFAESDDDDFDSLMADMND